MKLRKAVWIALWMLAIPMLVVGAWATITSMSGQFAALVSIDEAPDSEVSITDANCGCGNANGDVVCTGTDTDLLMSMTIHDVPTTCQSALSFYNQAGATKTVTLSEIPSHPGLMFETIPALPLDIPAGDNVIVNFRVLGTSSTIDYAGQTLPEVHWSYTFE